MTGGDRGIVILLPTGAINNNVVSDLDLGQFHREMLFGQARGTFAALTAPLVISSECEKSAFFVV